MEKKPKNEQARQWLEDNLKVCRYEPITDYDDEESYATMEIAKDGEYVLLADLPELLESYYKFKQRKAKKAKKPEAIMSNSNLRICLLEGTVHGPVEDMTKAGEFQNTTGFKVKVLHYGEGEEGISYFDILTWGNLAEFCLKHLKEKDRVAVTGELKEHRTKTESRVVIHALSVQQKAGKKSGDRA